MLGTGSVWHFGYTEIPHNCGHLEILQWIVKYIFLFLLLSLVFEIEKCGQKIKCSSHLIYIRLGFSLEIGVYFTLKLKHVCMFERNNNIFLRSIPIRSFTRFNKIKLFERDYLIGPWSIRIKAPLLFFKTMPNTYNGSFKSCAKQRSLLGIDIFQIIVRLICDLFWNHINSFNI